ncbi:recombinase family protein [Mesorhizobium sp.]|uniref:recombinase family protein n=1 Tax=Mesorhizobium sp. TaxID=1871066 RepID=UPI00257BF135|nr:recombinase family protein [Mesorhizobium sp.]
MCDENDTLIITKLGRLARSAAHLHAIVEGLNAKGVGFKVLDDPVTRHDDAHWTAGVRHSRQHRRV